MSVINSDPNCKKGILLSEIAELRAFRKDLLKFADLVDDGLHIYIAWSNNARIHGGAIICKIESQSWSAVEFVRKIYSPIWSSCESTVEACKSSVSERI